jgi:hypothetical protein
MIALVLHFHVLDHHQRNAWTAGLTASSAGTCFLLPTWQALTRCSLVGEIIARFEKRGFKVCIGREPLLPELLLEAPLSIVRG